MINNLAIIYKICIDIDFKTYMFIGHTFDLEKTKKEILTKLKNNRHENNNLQNKFNEAIRESRNLIGLFVKFETIQSLRTEYYPTNILPHVMNSLEKDFINKLRSDLKITNKEELLLN